MKKISLILLLALLLSSCGTTSSAYEADLFAMDTVMNLQVWSREPKQDVEALAAMLREAEAELSVTQPTSDVAQLNANGSGVLPELSRTLLEKTLALSQRTEGCLDPTIYPALRLWGFTTGSYQVPDAAALQEALTHTGTQHVHLDGDTVTLDPGTELDFGAVAKGCLGQLCADYLLEQDPDCYAVLSLGGNLQTVGSKPDGSDWRVGVTDPESPEESLAVLSLQGTNSVVTSGGYQRNFQQDGHTYCHILDPATGRPAENGLSSVTIVCQDGTTADGLSTALYVMGPEKAAAFWRESDDFEMVLVDDNHQVYVSEGLQDRISCDLPYQVIAR